MVEAREVVEAVLAGEIFFMLLDIIVVAPSESESSAGRWTSKTRLFVGLEKMEQMRTPLFW